MQSNTSATMAANTTFGLGTTWDTLGAGGACGVVGRASAASTFGGAFTQSAANGYAMIAAAVAGSGAAIAAWGAWAPGDNTKLTEAYIGNQANAGYFLYGSSYYATLCSNTYAGYFDYVNAFRAKLGYAGGAGRFVAGASGAETRVVELANGSYAVEVPSGGGSTKLQGFACNNATPQTAYTLNAASSDLSTVVALCNQIRTALINNGVCA